MWAPSRGTQSRILRGTIADGSSKKRPLRSCSTPLILRTNLPSAPSSSPLISETVQTRNWSPLTFVVHCWGYRRFLGDFFAIDPVKEFEYTSKKVYENFSNYSAWHRRAQLIPLLPESERREVIDSGLN